MGSEMCIRDRQYLLYKFDYTGLLEKIIHTWFVNKNDMLLPTSFFVLRIAEAHIVLIFISFKTIHRPIVSRSKSQPQCSYKEGSNKNKRITEENYK